MQNYKSGNDKWIGVKIDLINRRERDFFVKLWSIFGRKKNWKKKLVQE